MLHCTMPRQRLTYFPTFGKLLKSRKLFKSTLALQSAWLGGITRKPVAAKASVAPPRAPIRAPAAARQVPTPKARSTQESATFRQGQFQFGVDRYRYRVFVPAPVNSEPRPIIVMLHGCEQDAADFALGTDMNAVARRRGAIVVYPEQLRKSNPMACWNWYGRPHQQRGAGEAAMIAALALHVAARHHGDCSRIYVAGLSAGGAMAALAGALYPDVFAAVGVHSGLPAHAACDLASAVRAMRRGTALPDTQPAIPTIVVHGNADRTVRPENSDVIAQSQVAAWAAAGTPLRLTGKVNATGLPRGTCTTWVDAAGTPRLEAWHVKYGKHAWSGGKAAGTFTEPDGPNASLAMVRFFMRQQLGLRTLPAGLDQPVTR
jgi:poly(hydroxyalkanoate) depolymerase family esterase